MLATSLLLFPLLAPFAAAIPAEAPTPAPTATPKLEARAGPLAATAPWISVNKEGLPSTVTPIPTTISGTPTVESGAPNLLTGTVFTFTDRRQAQVTTSTGDPPLATARDKKGRGAFAPCSNRDGPNAPICAPEEGNEVLVGKTYYVTWDSSFPALKSNSSQKLKIKLKGYLVKYDDEELPEDRAGFDDDEEEEEDDEGEHEVYAPDSKHNKPSSHGFYPWHVDGKLVPKGRENATIHLKLQRFLYSLDGEEYEPFGEEIPGPTVLVVKPRKPESSHAHTDAELYIALPIVFGFVFFVLVGGCLWNRSIRRIGLGNVMSTTRKGTSGRMERAGRLLRKTKSKRKERGEGEEGLQLLDHMGGHDDDDEDDFDESRLFGTGPTDRLDKKRY